MTSSIIWLKQIDSETGIRKGTTQTEIVYVPHSQLPNIKTNFTQKIYHLYPFLSNINSKVTQILGTNFHINRLIHLLQNEINHWSYMFDWNSEDTLECQTGHWNYTFQSNSDVIVHKNEIGKWSYKFDPNLKNYNNKRGSYNSFKNEINSQAFGQLRNRLIFKKLPLREIEIAFNILESALMIAFINNGKLAYNYIGDSFDLTEDVIVNFPEIKELISDKLNKFIYELESNGFI